MINAHSVFFAGTATITAAAAIGGGLEASLWVGGLSLVIYSMVVALYDTV